MVKMRFDYLHPILKHADVELHIEHVRAHTHMCLQAPSVHGTISLHNATKATQIRILATKPQPEKDGTKKTSPIITTHE